MALRFSNTKIARAGAFWPAIFLAEKRHQHAAIIDDVFRFIARTVVNHDHFKVAKGLARDRSQRLAQQGGAIKRQDDDRKRTTLAEEGFCLEINKDANENVIAKTRRPSFD